MLKNEGTGPENSSRKSQQAGLKGTRSSLYQTHWPCGQFLYYKARRVHSSGARRKKAWQPSPSRPVRAAGTLSWRLVLLCFSRPSAPPTSSTKQATAFQHWNTMGRKRGRGGPASRAKSIKRSLKVIEQRGEEESDGVLWLLAFDGPLVAAHWPFNGAQIGALDKRRRQCHRRTVGRASTMAWQMLVHTQLQLHVGADRS